MQLSHKPVMVNEMLHYLSPQDGQTYIDATFGAGGYTNAILAKAKCQVIGIDQDPIAEQYKQKICKTYPDQLRLFGLNFADIDKSTDIQVDGIIFDIGVSTMQLKSAERGFSFDIDGPLDMRMNPNNCAQKTAKEIIDTSSEKKLADIIFYYGQETRARKIAKAIIDENKHNSIQTTKQLASIIHKSVGSEKAGKINSATKTFQALRIVVNNELESFNIALEKSIQMLKVGARLIVVTFHSLEDSIAKNFFKKYTYKNIAASKYADKLIMEKSLQASNSNYKIDLLNKKPTIPSLNEIKANPSSRSAKLRAGIKINDNIETRLVW